MARPFPGDPRRSLIVPEARCLVAVAALRFLYKVSLKKDWTVEEVIPAPEKPQTPPIVPSPEEVLQFLGCFTNTKHHAILTTCYAAGLRISEAIHLKPADIDSRRMVVRVEQDKGQKDRYTMLSPKLPEALRACWRAVRPKEWLFEGDAAGQPIGVSAVESPCQTARRRSGFRKPISPHSMRRAFAVHLLKSGTGIQEVVYGILLRAVALKHTYLTDFVVRHALRAAKDVIEEAEHVQLSERASPRILDPLENSPAPNTRLPAAAQALPQRSRG